MGAKVLRPARREKVAKVDESSLAGQYGVPLTSDLKSLPHYRRLSRALQSLPAMGWKSSAESVELSLS